MHAFARSTEQLPFSDSAFRMAAPEHPRLGLKTKAILFAFAVAIVGVGLDVSMARLLHRFWTAEIVGNVVTGAFAGYALFRYMVYRVNLSKQRATQIADLNHHIRNALSVIVCSHASVDDAQRLKLIREASERIQEALKQYAGEDHLKLPAEVSSLSSIKGEQARRATASQ